MGLREAWMENRHRRTAETEVREVPEARADRVLLRHPTRQSQGYSTDTEEDGNTYTSTGTDESAVLVTEGANITLKKFHDRPQFR